MCIKQQVIIISEYFILITTVSRFFINKNIHTNIRTYIHIYIGRVYICLISMYINLLTNVSQSLRSSGTFPVCMYVYCFCYKLFKISFHSSKYILASIIFPISKKRVSKALRRFADPYPRMSRPLAHVCMYTHTHMGYICIWRDIVL